MQEIYVAKIMCPIQANPNPTIQELLQVAVAFGEVVWRQYKIGKRLSMLNAK